MQHRDGQRPPSPNSPGCDVGVGEGLKKLAPQCNGHAAALGGGGIAAGCAAAVSAMVMPGATTTTAGRLLGPPAPGAASDAPAGSAPNLPEAASLPPMEDVIRWREFRRRQKWQGDRRRQSLGEKITGGEDARATTRGDEEGIGGTDSLSLSLSDSTAGNHRALVERPSFGAVPAPGNCTAEGDLRGNASQSPGSGIVEIDEEGFPLIPPEDLGAFSDVSPTSLDSEELREGKSTDGSEGDPLARREASAASSTEGQNEGTEERSEVFAALDCSVDAIENKMEARLGSSGIGAPGDRDSNNANRGKDETGDGDEANAHNDASTMLSAAPTEASPPSEVPTEITSNTARYVVAQSNLMARRMMNSEVALRRRGAGLRVSTSPSALAGAAVSVSDSGFGERAELAPTPAGEFTPRVTAPTPKFDTPGWDPTRTTVESDQLESVLATPKGGAEGKSEGEGSDVDGARKDLPNAPPLKPILEPLEEGGEDKESNAQSNTKSNLESNVSMVSSPDPMRISTIQEDDEDGQGKPNHTIEEISPANSKDSSCNTPMEDGIPTLDEVNAFMSQLQQLQKENSDPSKKKSLPSALSSLSFEYAPRGGPTTPIQGMVHLPAASPDKVVLREESLEFNRALMEKKEKLKRHKMDSDRKRREFEERLQAMRTRVMHSASPSPGGSSMGDGESKISMLPLGSTPRGAPAVGGIVPSPATVSTPREYFPADGKPPPSTSFLFSPGRPGLTPREDFPADKKPPFSPGTRWSSGLVPSPAVVRTPGASTPKEDFPTDKKLPSSFGEGARWSGGLARWGSPSPTNHDAPPLKLNVAVDEDDFSFKPPSVTGGDANIPISPVVGTGAENVPSRFNFPSPAATEHIQPMKFNFPSPAASNPPLSPMGTFLTSIGNAASSKFRSLSEPRSGRSTTLPVALIADSDVSSPSRQSSSVFTGVDGTGPFLVDNMSTPSRQESSFDRVMGYPSTPNNSILQSSFSGKDPSPRDDRIEHTTTASQTPPPLPPPIKTGISETSGSNLPSPDTSEGDKGGGIGSGFTMPSDYIVRNMHAGDKSIVSKSSSKFVELGLPSTESREDPPCEDLLGVTVKGSKKRRKKSSSRAVRASLALTFEPVDETSRCSGNSSLQESKSEDSSGDLPAVEERADDDNDSGNNRKPLDPDGFNWKELDESKRRKEKEQKIIAQAKQSPPTPTPPPPQEQKKQTLLQENMGPNRTSSVDKSEEFVPDRTICVGDDNNGGFAAVMDRVKTCLTPRQSNTANALNRPSSFHTAGTVNMGTVYETTSHFGNNSKNKAVMSSVHELRAKFELSSECGSIASDTSRAKLISLSEGGSVASGLSGVRSKSEGGNVASTSRKGHPEGTKNASLLQVQSFELEDTASSSRRDSPKGKGVPPSGVPCFESESVLSASQKDEGMQQKPKTKSENENGVRGWRKHKGVVQQHHTNNFKSNALENQTTTSEESATNSISNSKSSDATSIKDKRSMVIQQGRNGLKSKTAGIRNTPSEESADIDITNTKSSDAISVKDLRSRFESSTQQGGSKQPNPALSNGEQRQAQQDKTPQKSSVQLGSGLRESPALTKASIMSIRSSMIGSGIYLKNNNIQAMSSLESQTLDTAESSLLKSETIENTTIGNDTLEDGTLDTKKVLRYAKKLERRNLEEGQEETDLDEKDSKSIQSFENSIQKKDTNTSSLKENYHAGDGSGKRVFPHSNNVKSQRKVFEVKKNQTHQQGSKTPERTKKGTKAAVDDASLSSNKEEDGSELAASDNVVEAADTHNNLSHTTSVRDRIASFGGKKTLKNRTTPTKKNPCRSSNKSLPRNTQASPTKTETPPRTQTSVKKPLQQQQQHQKLTRANPPRTIATNGTKDMLSTHWILPNRNNTQGWTSKDSFINPNKQPPPHVNNNQRSTGPSPLPPPLSNMPSVDQGRVGTGRPALVQTEYETPDPSDYEDDDEDGITLSPTFSEVSGLTMPTCICTVNGDASVAQSDVFDNLPSPTNTRQPSFLPNFEAMSPIARHRHRKQQEKSALSAGAKLAKHPYLQRVNSRQSRNASTGPTNNLNHGFSTTEHDPEVKTPRAKGNKHPLSRREQIVSKVRASPRHKQFPQHSANHVAVKNSELLPNPSNSRSQECDAVKGPPIRHFRNSGPKVGAGVAGFLPQAQKSKGRVAESVERVNRKLKKGNVNGDYHRSSSKWSRNNHIGGAGESQRRGKSLDKPDCIRID